MEKGQFQMKRLFSKVIRGQSMLIHLLTIVSQNALNQNQAVQSQTPIPLKIEIKMKV